MSPKLPLRTLRDRQWLSIGINKLESLIFTELRLPYGQHALWFLDRLAPGNPAYVIAGAARIRDSLDVAALRRAATALVARHPALRTTFHDTPQGPVQRVHDEPKVEIVELEAVGLGEPELLRRLSAIAFRPFDLARGPLLRLGLVATAAGPVLTVSVHHIVADFWSLGVLLRDLGSLYGRELGLAAPLAPSPEIDPEEVVRREEESLAGARGAVLLAFWRQALAGIPLALDLPTDRPRPPTQGFRGASRSVRLAPAPTGAIKRLARRQGATLYMGLLTAFEFLLSRYSGQERLVVGCPTTRRTDAELGGLVGYLVNPVPIPADLGGDPTVAELLDRVRQAALASFAHQDYPLPLLAERLQPERDPGRSPLFQAVLILQKGRKAHEAGLAALAVGEAGVSFDLGPLALESLTLDEPGVQFDLQLGLADTVRGLAGRWLYDRDLFEPATMERMAGHFTNLLGALAEGGEAGLARPAAELPLLSAAERAQLAAEWAGTASAYPRESTVHALFAAEAARTPEAVALVAGGLCLTYGELAARAARLAGVLAGQGVGPEVTVALALPRSPALIVAMLGVLAAGGAYLPLDPSYPEERLAFMLDEGRAALLLASPELAERLPMACRVVLLGTAGEPLPGQGLASGPSRPVPRAAAGADSLAYVLFTSGSTGRPKGVAAVHRGVVRLVRETDYARFGPGEVFLQLAPASFDASTLEIWGALLHGGRLVLMPPEVPSLAELGAALGRHGVTTLWLTAGLFHQMVEENLAGLGAVRQLLAGGDTLSPAHVARVVRDLPGTRLIDGYGPTEGTTFTCCGAVVAADLGGAVPIGRPIANTRVYVLDREDRLVPVGVPGELAVGGDGLARGYLHRPDLTAERFRPHPLGEGDRLYRTGDRVRWRLDGRLDFLGRLDNQVKIRGFRIELGEVESALAACPGVRAAAVLARNEGAGRHLVAYVAGEGLDPEALRERLAASLPGYMVPAVFVSLAELPLTANGKVDRRALAAISPEAFAKGLVERGEAGPRTEVEAVVAAIWAEVLGVESVGVRDDFFRSGGHSLLATRLLSRLRRAFGVEIPLRKLFATPTVEALAREVAEARRTAAGEPPLRVRPRTGPPGARAEMAPSFAQERMWFLDQWQPGSAVYNLPGAVRLRGALDARALAWGLERLSERHETLRTTFALAKGGDGPVQVIAPAAVFSLPIVDLAGLPADRAGGERERLGRAEARRPFDLAAGPLLRATLLRLAEREHALFLSLHHIVGDGWSIGVLVRDLVACYREHQGLPSPLPELPIQYADFAAWQREWLSGEILEAQLAYWRERLAGAPGVLELPADRPRPPAQSFRGASFPVGLGEPLATGLAAVARRQGGTPFMVLLAAFDALLGRYTGALDLVVGSPVANRTRCEVEDLIGFFVNTLVLRADLSGDPTFLALLDRSRETTLGAYTRQDLPFEKLVEDLAPSRSLSHTPLFQVVLALQNTPVAALSLPGAAVERLAYDSGTAKFDLLLSLEETGGGFGGYLEYSTDLFDRTTAERLVGHLQTLLAEALADPGRRLSELPLLSGAEREELTAMASGIALQRPPELVLELFAAQARRRPEAPAVADGERCWSYGELASRVYRLAHGLRRRGVGPEDVVAICLPRSPELVWAILGTVAAGSAYLPLDPSHPVERLRYLLADSGARLLLTDAVGEAGLATATPVLRLEESSANEPESPMGGWVAPESLAYVIYTSGSTGKPKGTELTHGGLANLTAWHQREYAVRSEDRATLLAGVGFDASVWELWPYLTAGASLWLPPAEVVAAPAALAAWLAEARIDLCFLPTPLAEAVLAEPLPAGLALRALLTGGDRLHRGGPRGVGFGLFNHYGPTESTVVATWGEVAPEVELPAIGRPIANTRAWVLGPGLAPSPLSVPAELYLGGEGLARGYRGRPELTAERFVPDPSGEPGARLYRTGDLARRRPAGELEFLGRIDGQVKIRGFRVELGEIETALVSHAEIAQAAVLVREERPGDKRLVAYVAARPGSAPALAADLRRYLAERLAEPMVPWAFLVLPSLPLTPNGKVDRKALAALAPQVSGEPGRYAAPRTPTEEILARIWAQVLRTERVGIEDSFFVLGGHSLLATQVISRVRRAFGVELPLQALFESPTVAGLAARLSASLPGVSPGPVRVARGEGPPWRMPLSFAQERMWFLDQWQPGSPMYSLCGAVRLHGPLDVGALAGSLARLVRRHETLRTTFDRARGDEPGPMQVIAPALGAAVRPLAVADLAGLPAERVASESARLRRAEARRPFDLATGPLLGATLLRLAPADHVLLLSLHHIVGDGWSIGVLVRDVAAFYREHQGLLSPLPELPIQYADFAAWQREWLSGEVLEAQLAYWRERLAGAPEVLELPADRPRPPVQSFRGESLPVALGGTLAASLAAVARHQGGTPFMVLLAAFDALLGRYTGALDLVVGSPVANRTRREVEDLIGFFVNTLVLRADLSGDPTFLDLLDRTRETTLGGYARQDLPFERLVEELAPGRSLSHTPLFQVALALQNTPVAALSLPGIAVERLADDNGTVKFDLLLSFEEADNGLGGYLEYSADRFDRTTAERLLGHFATLLGGALANPDRRLSDLPLLTAEERTELLTGWAGAASPYPRASTIHALFAEQAARTPDSVALVAGGECLSYGALHAGAVGLAGVLAALGVGPEVLVALAIPRSSGLVAATLAVLAAGGAYLPLDPSYPQERLAFMLEEGRVTLLLTTAELAERLPAGVQGARAVLLAADGRLLPGQDLPASRPTLGGETGAENLAYVMFTSGSTGRPKGVAVVHRGVVRLVSETDYARFGPEEVFLQLAPASFDASTLEIWGALLHGGRLVLMPPEKPTLSGLGEALARHGVTTLWLTAGLFHQMVEENLAGLVPLRQLLAGGDTLSPALVARAARELSRTRLINGYGPTEGTTFTCCWPVVAERLETGGTVPIGRPITNTRVFVLDREEQLAAVGLPGELVVGGDGLARGYLGRPELTADRFRPDPFGGGGDRLYRTGDLVRWRTSGELEFLGRLDQQVKIRGFRIEPGEIEAVLAGHPEVGQAAVLVREERRGDKRLVAYAAARPGAALALAPADLRSYLAERLPEHLVPGAFVLLPVLPLTPNGKVDRRALAALAPDSSGEPGIGVAPRTPVEALVAGIWAELLGIERVGIEDSFFDLGGHSLLATRVVSRIARELGVELPVRALFESPTVAGLAARIAASLPGVSSGPVRVDRGEGPPWRMPLSFAQERLWFLDRMEPGTSLYNVAAAVRLTGDLDVSALARSLAAVIGRHEALRTRFEDLGGEPVQRIDPPAPGELPLVDLSDLPDACRCAAARVRIREEALRPYDLAAGPLLRATLLCLAGSGPAEHVLLLTLHHVIADGWSIGVLIREISFFYRAAVTGAPMALPPLPVQYADFAAWQRRWLAGEVYAAQLGYWRTQLAGAPALELPADRPRPAVPSHRGGVRHFVLPAALTAQLAARARQQEATLFMALLAGFAALLGRYTGQEDLLLGSPIANRTQREIEDLIGFFVNTLVLRVDLGNDPGFAVLLSRVRATTLGAYVHQDLPFEKLVGELAPERSTDRTPLFQVMLALQEAPTGDLALPGLEVDFLDNPAETAKFDLSLACVHSGNGLSGHFVFRRDLFDPPTLTRLAGHLERLLAAALAAPERRLSELPLLAVAELQQILMEWNEPQVEYPEEGLLPDLVAARAERQPDHVVVAWESGGLTYGELAARAHRLARYLVRRGAGPELWVGLAALRSPEMVVALLAILETGAAYLPLDPDLPAERLAFMVADSGARLVLTTASLAPRLPAGCEVVCLDRDAAAWAGESAVRPLPAESAIDPDTAAYVLYTSGSTGQPKGVVITHGSMANRLRFHAATDLREPAALLQKTTISFDVSVLEVFGPLLSGGRMVLARPGGQQDVPYLVHLLAEQQIEHVTFPPSLLALLLEEEGFRACRSLRMVVTGSEAVPAELASRFGEQLPAELFNRYGPTEATIAATAWRCRPERRERVLPIGRPIARAEVLVLNRDLHPVPVGVPGEIGIGGIGLARGYLDRPDLTAEKFVPHPCAGNPGARLYRTGDLARFRPDGALEFLGRLDGQVKIRGNRIELGEVEAALVRQPGVQAAVVLARDDGGRIGARLVAYWVPAAGAPGSSSELRSALASLLPASMVPAVFVRLDALPLAATGKVDRRALVRSDPRTAVGSADAADAGEDEGTSFVPPATATERRLAEIFADLLGLDPVARPVSRADDFFALGGHSLLATRLASRLRDAFGIDLPLRRVFEAPMVAALAAEIDASSAVGPGPLPAVRREPGATHPLSFAQERLWFLDQLQPGSAAYNMPAALHLAGRLDLPSLAVSLSEIVRRHEALRTTFRSGTEGPVQVIVEAACPLPVVDLRGLRDTGAGEREGALRALLAAAARQPFDLARGPLLRALLLCLGEAEHVLFVNLHHIVADGWSTGIFVREVAALYGAFTARRPSPLPELAIQYADFAVWQRRWLSGETLESRLGWWREQLAGVPLLELPADRPRPVEGFRGRSAGVCGLALPPALHPALRSLATRQGATLFMTLLAAFEGLLARYSGQTEFAVGSVIANRTHSEVEGLIGFFVNTLALRGRLAGDPGFSALLARVRETTVGAYAHQDVPFELVVEALAPARDLARTPLFDTVLNLQTDVAAPPALRGLDVAFLPLPPGPAKFDLTLSLVESEEGLTGSLSYRPELFDAATAERLAGHLVILLAGAAADPESRVSALPLLAAAERQELTEWNDTAALYPGGLEGHALHGRVSAQAERTPDAVAVAFDRQALSYGQLAAEAGRLARRLRRLGVGPEVPVGICLERSLDLVVGLLAILEAGGAYVPLDPSYPRERLAGMLMDAGAPVVLTWRRLAEALPVHGGRTVFLDEPSAEPETAVAAPVPVDPDGLAYVIFTSGSTGRPKGAMNTHRAIVNRLLWMQETYGLTAEDRVLQKTPASFDVSVWEFFWPLLTGACLVVARPGEHREPARLARTIAEEAVTTLHFVPAMLQAFLEEPAAGSSGSVRRVVASGEALPAALAERFSARLPGASLHNLYGPTEAAVDVTSWACRPGWPRPAIPIGRPVANTAIHLLDAALEPVPVGVPGELWIGGVQVGRGYLGRPELTAERFLPDPAGAPGGRLYRTGDLVRRLPGGEIEFLGRIDHQVKIRGLRIELGEIEAALARHPGVQEAVVLAEAGPTGDPADLRLVAYVVPEARRAAPLRARLRLERQGRLAPSDLHELPNGLTVAHRNRGETEFLFREIFEGAGYLRHGVALADGDTVFDVGANIGLFALFAGRRARGIRIYAFEPIPEVFATLSLNAALHGLDARLFDCGLADVPGSAELTYYPHATLISGRFADGAEEREVVRAFVQSQAGESGELAADRLEELLAERLESRRVTCRLRTLSEVIAEEGVLRIDLLKIDVEKSEVAVLAGIREEDWAKVRQVVLEVHDIAGRLSQVLSLLERHGFEVAAEQDAELRGTGLYNLYARRPASGPERPATPPEPAWESAGRLIADLTAALRDELPEFMVPAAFALLDALPLSPSGKVDRRALARESPAAGELRGRRTEPRSPAEKLLAGLWAELLRLDPAGIGIEDSFFALGGHSLLAARLLSRLESSLGIELPLRRLFAAPTLGALAREVEASGTVVGERARPPARPARPAELPLSFSQERLWFLDQLEPGSAAYNVPAQLRLRGTLRPALLAAVLGEIVRRHEALRTTFSRRGERPVQVIAAESRVGLPLVDLTALPEPRRHEAARVLTTAAARRPFDLARGPLLRVLLLRLATGGPGEPPEHVVLMSLHHIVSDGWSTGVLIRELAALYGALLAGRPSTLPELPWQYADFALWQRELLAGPELARQLAWWRERLAGAPEALELPTDRPRPPVQTFRGAHHPLALPAGLAAAVRSFSEAARATLFMTLLAAFDALLARWSGQPDVTVGSPIAGRRRTEVEGLIGFFVNTLALRLDLSGRPSFRELAARARELTLGAFEHQDVPFEKLVEELRPARQLARTPLFQVMFAVQNASSETLSLPGLELAILPIELGIAKFDLTLGIREREGRLVGGVQYNRDLFDAATIARLAAHFETLLAGALAAPDRAFSELPLLTEGERQQALREWNDRPEDDYPREGLVHELVAARAAERPVAPAVGFGSERMSYGELGVRAARIARHLRAHGVGPESLVGVAVERSFALVAALLGIWKAGGAYLPLDGSLPAERLGFLLADAKVEIVLTQASLQATLPAFDGSVLPVEDLWESEPAGACIQALSDLPELAERAAYVLYTSGSTGKPKGVVISHRSLGNRLRFAQAIELAPGESFVQKTTTSFDASISEIWSPLLVGGTTVLARPGGERDPAYLVELMREWRIPLMSFTMTLLKTLLEEQSLAGCDSLRKVLVGGEAVPPDLPERFHAQSKAEIWNRYGPTETTISVLGWRCERGWRGSTVPIGRPFARTQVYVLDPDLQLLPVGVPGELCIGGPGLARGYLARPEVTAERFIPHPFAAAPGERLYRSGDLVRFRTDGAIEFVGRIDGQVKIRGFRVELGEIEAALGKHPALERVAVVDREDPATGSRRLVAYLVPRPEAADLAPRALQAFLEATLPAYMVPSAFVRLDALPLTPTGKLDRRALPTSSFDFPEEGWEAPQTPIEELLAGIWEELLDVRRVDRRASFFDLGGHSLLATRLVSRLREALGVELPLKAVFEEPTLSGLAQLAGAARCEGGPPTARPLRPVPRGRDLPLSFAQERLWFLDQLEPGNASYHLPVAVRFRGRLAVAALASALSSLAARHESLRTRFLTVEGRPAQAVSPALALTLPAIDLTALPPGPREAAARLLARGEARRPFDLEAGPLVRLTLLRLGAEEHIALFVMHHIVSDGWSMGVLVRELGALYGAAVAGLPSPLPPLPVQYPDFAVWQREWLSGEVLAAELAWWRERLAGAPARLELPTDRPRPPVQAFRGASLPFRLPAELTARLEALCRQRGTTPFMALLATFETLLWRRSGQEDLVVGTPVANRTRREVEGLIGFFVNTLALRGDLAGEPAFAELLARVREQALGAYAHQDLPFEKLVEALAPERSLAHSPIFQVFLVLQNTPAQKLELPGLTLEPVELGSGVAKFDLTLALGQTPAGLVGAWEYDRALFDAPTIARLSGQMERLLAAVVAEPAARLGDLPLLSPAERQQLLDWNGTAAVYRETSLSTLLFESAARTPEAVAVVFERECLTYGELAARAGCLASELRGLGVGPEVRVGICAERSLGLIEGLFAILQAGAAYVPLDPSYPTERLAFMLEDSGVAVLLAGDDRTATLATGDLPVVRLDNLRQPRPALPTEAPAGLDLDPDHLAYVIYTSGSTGRPKGAMNSHRGIVNRLLWMGEQYAFGAADRVLQKTPVSFDVSVWELFLPLLSGACLVLARPGGHQDPAYLVETITREEVTVLHFVPAMLRAFLEAPEVERSTALRQVIASGEALPYDLERRFFGRLGARLDNLYGPTEAAVDVTFWSCDPAGRAGRVPVGRPVANTEIRLLGRHGEPLPPGAVGELCIAGVQVGRGYLDRPELTAERFVPDSGSALPGARLYRTGDLARHLPDGAIEYLGRIDHQVKLRGFRIELGEIESALLGHAGVRDAAARVWTARPDVPGDPRLVAYVVPERPGEELADALRTFLSERLPGHMVPATIVTLPSLPLSPNGKVDRQALPAPDWRASSLHVAPRTVLEEVVASFFAEVLGIDRVGADDGFFHLGGHSLLAMQLVSKIRGAFQVELPVKRLFETPTVAAVAAAIAMAEARPGQSEKIARVLLRVRKLAQEKRPDPIGDTDESAVERTG